MFTPVNSSTDRSNLNFAKREDRLTPALFGQTWVNPNNFTFSVVADGTDVAGVPSNLHATLGTKMTDAE